jgi:pSer/pThr/pTyr-binding forkhead associated (FHA) protein
MDLNSTNGTFVNSRRVSNQILIHNDIVSIGNHRIKFVDPGATSRSALEVVNIEDTVIMKDLSGMRKMLASEHTELMPLPANLEAAVADKK